MPADILSLAGANLLSPMTLCFALGALAAFVRSDLEFPDAIAKGLAIYLMLAIGMKGGVALAGGASTDAILAIVVAGFVSFLLPVVAYALLRAATRAAAVDAAAIGAHYGSVSVVTFVTASEFLAARGMTFEGYLVAMMAVMETPAIVMGLLLARRAGFAGPRSAAATRHLWREVLFNGSIVLLVGGFLIGWIVGAPGYAKVKPFLGDLFNGLLCLFLLDMGVVAMRQLRAAPALSPALVGFALVQPLIGAAVGLGLGSALGLSVGGVALFATLCASASYIAVPAAMRLALPKANPALYLTLSLGVTFPFNVAIGIPLYTAIATALRP
ncbi:MAG: sodium-dependent bicarbonate transport family permease [Alphaproteobacteria bacterium]|nr:sodium-dependent bicarbonate transport family permease [Alphaproteobacteria bacterium]